MLCDDVTCGKPEVGRYRDTKGGLALEPSDIDKLRSRDRRAPG